MDKPQGALTTTSTQAEIDIVDKLGAILATDEKTSHTRYLWYGDLGEGKTYLTGILHKILVAKGTRGCFGMDFDGAMRNVLKSAQIDMPVKTYVDKNAYDEFENDIAMFASDNHGFGAIVIDPLTAFEAVVMQKVMRVNPIKRNFQSKVRLLPQGAPSPQDYGIEFGIINNVFKFLQATSLHMNVVMTAHILARENPVTNITEFLPAISGKKMPSSIGRWFNEVWRIHGEMRGEKIVRYAQTASYNKFKCKSQVHDMPHDLPVEEALQRTIDAYMTGKVEPVPDAPLTDETHPGDMLSQKDVDSESEAKTTEAEESISPEELLGRMMMPKA